jgi:hypothetical protein
LDVIEAPAMELPRSDRGGVAASDEVGQEVLRLLAVFDARERAELSFDEDS